MIRIFQETNYFATKQIFCASNLDSIPTSLFWFQEFFLLFHKILTLMSFLKDSQKRYCFLAFSLIQFSQQSKWTNNIICPKKTTRFIQVSLYCKTVALFENSYRKRALVAAILPAPPQRLKLQMNLPTK